MSDKAEVIPDHGIQHRTGNSGEWVTFAAGNHGYVIFQAKIDEVMDSNESNCWSMRWPLVEESDLRLAWTWDQAVTVVLNEPGTYDFQFMLDDEDARELVQWEQDQAELIDNGLIPVYDIGWD